MANVKVFAEKQIEKHTGQNNMTPIYRCSGMKKQDVFVKHQCPRNTHLLRNTTLIFDLDLCR